MSPAPPNRVHRLGPGLAAALVFLAAASVLVLEIAAGRLLAPYVGVSLTTYTGIIGVILGGIALGAWLGGRAADAVGPLRLLGPTFVLGGLAAMASVPIVDLAGSALPGGDVVTIVVLATVGFVVPAAVLSAVTPMIVRATLDDLRTSGTLVGRLSAIGTVGAITGTFLTGFVLLGLLPTRAIILGTGGLVVAVGLALGAWTARGRGPGAGGRGLGALAAMALVTGSAVAAPDPCQRESAYYCIAVVDDPSRSNGRTLVLDRLRHAYVALGDPDHLEFAYVRWFDAAVAPLVEAAGGDVDVLYVGGGGFSFPRHLAAAHPASRHTVLELDPVVHEVARTALGFDPGPGTRVVLGDARLSIADEPTNAADIVVGDAFGGLSVPWHLTTTAFVAEVDRVLRPDGRYVMNLIDGPGLRFVRAEAATLRTTFEHVAVVAPPATLAGEAGGNVVLVASHAPLDGAAVAAAAADRGDTVEVLAGPDAVDRFTLGAPVLTDDYAPVDQLIGR